MFEPLSALAVLGFAMGTLGCIVSTISKVDEKIKDIHECKSRLRSFNWQLEDAYLELRVWHSIWIGKKAFPRETYVHFWGIEGLDDIQSRVGGITELSDEIKVLLRQPGINESGKSLSHSELKVWHDLIDRDVAELPSWGYLDHRKAGLVHKIGFTLFHNASLLEKIGRLKSHVEGLRDYAQKTFRLKQQTDPNQKVTPPELRHTSDLKIFVDQISTFASLLYQSRLPSSRLEWAIELGPPDAGYALDLWSEVDRMYIDFMVRDTALDVETRASRVRISVEEKPAQTGFIVQRVHDVVLSHGEHLPEFSRLFSLLEKPARRSRPLRKMLTEGVFSGKDRKSFEVERADLIYGLGHWMILLWNTPWSRDLCTCGIRCTLLADTHTRHSFSPNPQRSHRYPMCHPSKLAEDRFILLGIALAEIALALPISVILEHENTTYVVGEELVSQKRLLGMLRERFGRNTITKAISYCLDPNTANLGDSLAYHFEKYCENVVSP